MGRHQTKPWQRGYIPKPGRKPQNPAFTAPEAPEGWVREDRRDWNEYSFGAWGSGWQIIGRAGAKWRVFRARMAKTEDVLGWVSWDEIRDEVFKSDSFDACVTFVKIEQSNEDEKPAIIGFDPAARGGGKTQLFSQRYHGAIQGRAAGKISAGEMLTQMAQADSLMKAFRESYPSFTQTFHDEMIHDCRDPVAVGTAAHEALARADFSGLEGRLLAYCAADVEATKYAK